MACSPLWFDTQVQVKEVTKSYDGLGDTETWVDIGPVDPKTGLPTVKKLWCSFQQPTKNLYMSVQVQYGQRFNKTTIWRMVVREKQDWNYATTRFLWDSPNKGQRVMQPVENVRFEGSRHTAYASILVEDVTDLQAKPAG